MKPDDLRALAAEHRARSDLLLAEGVIPASIDEMATAERLDAMADELEAILARHRRRDLHNNRKASTLNRMDVTPAKENRKRAGRPPTPGASKHPFVRRAIELYGSVRAAAAALDRRESTLQGWYTDDPDRQRTIPPAMIELFAAEPWNIPARAWRRK